MDRFLRIEECLFIIAQAIEDGRVDGIFNEIQEVLRNLTKEY